MRIWGVYSKMIFLRISDKEGNIKFSDVGYCIDAQYRGVFNEGDRISIYVDGRKIVALKLDSTLKESFLYLPNKSFTFEIPAARVLEMAYPPNAF